MDRSDLYTDIPTQENINNNLWCPIFECANTCELSKSCYMIFEVFQSANDRYCLSKYHVSLGYNTDTKKASIRLSFLEGETTPIEICYVVRESENKVVFYAKPFFQGRSVSMKILHGTRVGNFKLLPWNLNNVDLSSEEKIYPKANVVSNTYVPAKKNISKNTYVCNVGTNIGNYLIGKIFCSNGYCSNVLSLLITTSEGDNKEFAQSIVTIRYRKIDNSTFSHRISVIDGANSDNKTANGIIIGVANIDQNNLGIYLNFTKPYSGVTITVLSFSSRYEGRFIYVDPEYVDNVTFAKSMSLDSKIAVIDKKVDALKKNTRIFRPNFGCTFYLGQANDLKGSHYTKSLEDCKVAVDKVIDYIDEVPINFHISFNEDTNEFYIVEDLDIMYNLCLYIVNEKNKKISALKMYAQKYNVTHINNYGIVAFHTKWKEFINTIANKFTEFDIPYFTIHNESNYLVADTKHLPYLLQEITLAKSLGFKVGYDYAGAPDYYNCLDEFKEQLDFHALNIYPCGSTLGELTTYSEVLNAFKNEESIEVLRKMKIDYPNSDVIINECGVQDNWYALARPSKYTWNKVVSSGGLVPAMYLQALLETTKDMDVSHVWWWFELGYDKTREILNRYLGGEN